MTEKIWFANPVIKDLEWMYANTLAQSLDIRVTEIGNNYLVGTMPVDNRTKQPFGLLHGGASVSLAETLGSIASWLVINPELFIAVGIEINANHIKAVQHGLVTATCSPIHIKGKNHIWDIRLVNELDELTCISRFMCTIVPKNRFDKK